MSNPVSFLQSSTEMPATQSIHFSKTKIAADFLVHAFKKGEKFYGFIETCFHTVTEYNFPLSSAREGTKTQ